MCPQIYILKNKIKKCPQIIILVEEKIGENEVLPRPVCVLVPPANSSFSVLFLRGEAANSSFNTK